MCYRPALQTVQLGFTNSQRTQIRKCSYRTFSRHGCHEDRRPQRLTFARGFTLTEMAVVLVIVALLITGLVIPFLRTAGNPLAPGNRKGACRHPRGAHGLCGRAMPQAT
ncbi:MAG: type II secretion system GspH family protein [Rhodocyclaceae bacterium]|nr:type II secretion system GspH family protein [Rhodocyclaceae bacterium]